MVSSFAFETAVYLELRRRRPERKARGYRHAQARFGQGGRFSVEGDATLDEASVLVQVCFDMSDAENAGP